MMKIGNIRERSRSSEGVSAKGGTLTKGLQSPVHRFDSGRRLQPKPSKLAGFSGGPLEELHQIHRFLLESNL